MHAPAAVAAPFMTSRHCLGHRELDGGASGSLVLPSLQARKQAAGRDRR
jgi:hypothetical protein